MKTKIVNNSILNTKKEFINKIYDQNFKFYNPTQAITQSNLLDSISFDIYTYSKRFLIEILQNSDDSSFEYKSSSLNLAVTMRNDILIISHRGRSFDELDISSLCSAGNSTKSDNKKATGYKGIGFKSVFAVSNKVLVISNGYNFKFDKDYFNIEKCWQDEWNNTESEIMKKKIKKPWQIIPIWIEKDELDDSIQSACKDYEVNFVFYLKDKNIVDNCKSALTELFEKNPMNILFLKSKEISITYNENKKLKAKIQKKLLENGVIEIQKDKKSSGLFFIHNFSISREDFLDEMTKTNILSDDTFPDKLKYATSIDISFACKIKKNESLYEAIPFEPEERLIYSYLPTIENLGFPFIVNSNFLLDAGRINLKEHVWNLLIFKQMPNLFLTFYEIVLKNFGNSFVNLLVNKNFDEKEKVTNKYFLNDKFYITNFKNSLQLTNLNQPLFKTKQGNIQPFTQCYIENFELNDFKNISDLFTHIYGVNGANILEEFFSPNSNTAINKFKFLPEFEVDKKKLDTINILKEYFNLEFKIIEEQDFLSFLKSDVYKKYADSESLLKICSLYKNNLDAITEISIFFGEDTNFDNFFPCRQFSFSNGLDVIENLRADSLQNSNLEPNLKKGKGKKTANAKTKTKAQSQLIIVLNNDIIQTFTNSKEVSILTSLGANFIDINEWSFVYNKISKDYSESNSIERINEAFQIWLLSDITIKKQITQYLRKLRFLTNTDKFLYYQCINIGNFYRVNESLNRFDKFYDTFSFSEKYFININNTKNTSQEFYKFLIQIGFLAKDSNVVLLQELTDEIIFELPYYDQVYKDYLKPKVKRNQADMEFLVYPFLDFMPVEDPRQYRDNLLKIIDEKTKNKFKFTPNLEDYLLYYVKRFDLFPTNKLNLLPIKKIYSPDIKQKMENAENAEKLMDEVFEFPDKKLAVHFSQSQLEFKKDLSSEDYPLILDRVVKEIENINIANSFVSTGSGLLDKNKMIKIFQTLLEGLIKRDKDFSYTGFFQNSEGDFQKAEELYFIIDENKKNLLINTVEKLKLKELLPINKFDSFFHFCRKNNVRIYDKNSITYEAKYSTEKTLLRDKLIKNFKIVNEIIQIFNNNPKTGTKIPKLQIAKLNKLRFFSCLEIIIKTTPYKDVISGVPCYYEKVADNFHIYYEENDVYDWNHSTVIYYISYYISLHLKCESLKSEIMSILLSKDDCDVESLKKISISD